MPSIKSYDRERFEEFPFNLNKAGIIYIRFNNNDNRHSKKEGLL